MFRISSRSQQGDAGVRSCLGQGGPEPVGRARVRKPGITPGVGSRRTPRSTALANPRDRLPTASIAPPSSSPSNARSGSLGWHRGAGRPREGHGIHEMALIERVRAGVQEMDAEFGVAGGISRDWSADWDGPRPMATRASNAQFPPRGTSESLPARAGTRARRHGDRLPRSRRPP